MFHRHLMLRAVTMIGPGLIPPLVMLAFDRVDPHAIVRTALRGTVYSLCISSLCWWIVPRVAEPLLRKSSAARWTQLVAIIAAIATTGCLFGSVVLFTLGGTAREEFWVDFFKSLKVSFLLTLIFGIVAFFHEAIVSRLNAATKDAERLRQMATEARLSSLESRVHPHFLFNTLNSISALIREDPMRAERMVGRLASLLRFSLDANESGRVPLSLELKIVRDYLEIEQARFGARLRYRIDVPTAMNEVEIPPMSVQTLVENSVKHAVSTRREGATVEVRARMEAGVPIIDVIDDGPGFDETAVKSGHGLDLLQSRLAVMFGPNAALQISCEPGRMRTTVVLS